MSAFTSTFAERLDRLALLALRVGVNFQSDGLLRISAGLEAAPLVRRIAALAYDEGARYVDVHYGDPELSLVRAVHAREQTLDHHPQEHADLANAIAERGDATIRVSGTDPDLMSRADGLRVARMARAAGRALRPARDLAMRSFMPWTIVPCATPGWARKVFPHLGEHEAMERLWEAIFAATRADAADPFAAWRAHAAALDTRARHLSEWRFDALHLRGPGTDLRVGLAPLHVWEGASATAEVSGLPFVANIPTEEVFTAPHARRVDGVVRVTKPLSYRGQLVDGIVLSFEGGVVSDATAQRGERVLQSLLETDDGARRLGEVALVPHASPISCSGLLFFDTLFDENAASHLALGNAYPTCVAGGLSRSLEELAEEGLNRSLVHVDVMIGSGELDVIGIHADGTARDVMRQGAWVLETPLRGFGAPPSP